MRHDQSDGDANTTEGTTAIVGQERRKGESRRRRYMRGEREGGEGRARRYTRGRDRRDEWRWRTIRYKVPNRTGEGRSKKQEMRKE